MGHLNVCFNNCPVYADAGANAKFTTSLDETHCGVHKSLLSMSLENLHFSLLNKVIFFSDLWWYQWRGSEVAPMVFMLCGKPLNGGCEPRAIWINDHSPIKQTLLEPNCWEDYPAGRRNRLQSQNQLFHKMVISYQYRNLLIASLTYKKYSFKFFRPLLSFSL
jgi:hypothetical protein